jgi:hypothetical protein
VGYSSNPSLELLWWSGCPSWERALAILREEAEAVGLDPDSIQVRQVETDEAARREGFIGSPTIRVDGADLQPPREQPTGLTCRVYRLRDGRVSALPDRADVREALEAATEGEADE